MGLFSHVVVFAVTLFGGAGASTTDVIQSIGQVASILLVMALAFFKIAIIAAGIQFRDRMGGGTEYGDTVGAVVAPLIAAGLTDLARL